MVEAQTLFTISFFIIDPNDLCDLEDHELMIY